MAIPLSPGVELSALFAVPKAAMIVSFGDTRSGSFEIEKFWEDGIGVFFARHENLRLMKRRSRNNYSPGVLV